MKIAGLTYNLKYREASGPHAWRSRRPLVAEQLRRAGADVVGTQEGLHGQLRDIVADTDRYEWVGVGREGDGHGEQAAVLYDPAVLTAVDQGHFWLSDTPEVPGSASPEWGNEVVRMATWVRLRHRDGTEFTWLNTHLDHASAEARRRGATLVADRLAGRDGLPVVVSGDFNTTPGSEPYKILTAAGFADAWGDRPEHGTYGGWRAPTPGGDRIDWILTRGGIRATDARILDHHDGDRWPSDHVPVRVELSTEA